MLRQRTIDILNISSNPKLPPAGKSDICDLEALVGRPLCPQLRHFWSLQNGYVGRAYGLSGVTPGNPLFSDAIRVFEIFSQHWGPLGWIPIGDDDLGGCFVSIPTTGGDVVGYIDLAFDWPATVLCAVGSSVDAFIYNLVKLDRSAEMEDSEPCDIASMDENIAAAVEAVGPWLKREDRFG